MQGVTAQFVGGALDGTSVFLATADWLVGVELLDGEFERYEREKEPFAKIGSIRVFRYNFKEAVTP